VAARVSNLSRTTGQPDRAGPIVLFTGVRRFEAVLSVANWRNSLWPWAFWPERPPGSGWGKQSLTGRGQYSGHCAGNGVGAEPSPLFA
jgi:hypothetical protein